MLRRKREVVELPEGAVLADLMTWLTGDEKRAAVIRQTRPFVDGQQAERTAPLHDGAEVVLMRPIAGGEKGIGDRGQEIGGRSQAKTSRSGGVMRALPKRPRSIPYPPSPIPS
jgi:hypothetical protein